MNGVEAGPVIVDEAKPKHEATRYDTTLLIALQRKPIYAGTVAFTEKAKRRAKGKLAKVARKLNR